METQQIPKVPPSEFRYERRYTKPGITPFDAVKWELRDAVIVDHSGKAIFEQKRVEVPASWSQTATNIVASKYFRGKMGTPERESSVRQLIGRVSGTIAKWGREGKYFLDEEEAAAFEAELAHILLYQMAAFNSPVWFNLGAEEHPQVSACFIQSVRDDMKSILQLAVNEGMLFKFGSGTGSNLSTLRSSSELLSSGGRASGPVSFMKGFDAFAGVIKSGGRTRRAAKMVILNIDHPDVVEFIWSKAKEEKKAWTLIDAGYDGSVDGEAYGSVFFQNANHSVRVTDEFMHAVAEDKEWKVVRDAEQQQDARKSQEERRREAYKRLEAEEREARQAREEYRRETRNMLQVHNYAWQRNADDQARAAREAQEERLRVAKRRMHERELEAQKAKDAYQHIARMAREERRRETGKPGDGG